MEKITKSNISRWGINPNEEKFQFLKGVIEDRFQDELKQKPLSGFYDFLMSEPHYRYSGHLLRYVETFARMTRQIPIAGRIVETGGSSPILDYIVRAYPDCDCYVTESDLRLEMDCKSDFADIVLSFEVIEHIKDQPEEVFDDIVLFSGTGVRRFVQEMTRITKPGGHAFLTTPNPVSSAALDALLNRRAPMIFRPHVREYTREELIDLYQDWSVEAYAAMYCFFLLKGETHKLKQIYQTAGLAIEDRGDDHFFHFRKKG